MSSNLEKVIFCSAVAFFIETGPMAVTSLEILLVFFFFFRLKAGERGEQVIPIWSDIGKQAFSILPVFAYALSAASLCLPQLCTVCV